MMQPPAGKTGPAPARRRPPPSDPNSAPDADVAAWASRHGVDVDGWFYRISDNDLSYFVRRETIGTEEWPVIRTWFRAVSSHPDAEVGSYVYYAELDCAHHRMRTLSVRSYSDLNGETSPIESRADDKAPWEFPIPYSVDWELQGHACLAAKLMKLQAENG